MSELASESPAQGEVQDAARAAWAMIKLSDMGARSVAMAELVDRTGLPGAEIVRLLMLAFGERVEARDGVLRLDATPAGPPRYRVDDGARPLGWGGGCSVDMYLLALALDRPVHAEATCPTTGQPITIDIGPERVERIDPPTAVLAVVGDLTTLDITGGPAATDAQICTQQPFFASADAAAGWLHGHPGGRLVAARDFHEEARRLVAALERPGFEPPAISCPPPPG